MEYLPRRAHRQPPAASVCNAGIASSGGSTLAGYNSLMLYLEELSLPPAQQLALDELLLLQSEAGQGEEYLRLWELAGPAVVIGRGTRLDDEVDRTACQRAGVPILRRSSGGAAIVAAAGCLFYSLVLSLRRRPQLRSIDQAHRLVLTRTAHALVALGCSVEPAGISDLALPAGGQLMKISGNSLRVRRHSLLYHGTLLYDFDLSLIERLLKQPPRQPEYRHGRAHRDFVTNLPLERTALVGTLVQAWSPLTPCDQWPRAEADELAEQKYATPQWNERL